MPEDEAGHEITADLPRAEGAQDLEVPLPVGR